MRAIAITIATLLLGLSSASALTDVENLEQFLHSRSDVDLAAVESDLIRSVIANQPATLLSSSTRDWYLSLPEVFGLPSVSPEEPHFDGALADQLLASLPKSPLLSPEAGAD